MPQKTVLTTTVTVLMLLAACSVRAQSVKGDISFPTALFGPWPAVNQTVRLVALRELPRAAFELCREHDTRYRGLAEVWDRVRRERTTGRYTAYGLQRLAIDEQEVVDSLAALFDETAAGMSEILFALTIDEAFAGVAARYRFEGIPPGEYALWAETFVAEMPYRWWLEFRMPAGELVTHDLTETSFAEVGLPFDCERFGFGAWRARLGPLPERRWALPIPAER